MKRLFASSALTFAMLAGSANAATITLTLVDSFARTSAFGLAFDGSKIWWSDNGGSVHEMTTGGVDTGNVITGTQWSALAWDGTTNRIAEVNNNGIDEYNRATTGSQTGASLFAAHTHIAGDPNFLVDGLDIHGSTLYWSPDVSFVNTSPLDGSGTTQTFLLKGSGGFSGVQFVSVASSNYVFVVNDASSPRQLCYHDAVTAAQIGCTVLANSRYEDLAFDGRYLYAADYYGNRIDKIDVLSDGASVFVPPAGGVPEPATWTMMLVGFGGLGAVLRRRRHGMASVA